MPTQLSFVQQIQAGLQAVRQFAVDLGIDERRLEWGPMDGEARYPLMLRTEMGSRVLVRLGKNELARYSESEVAEQIESAVIRAVRTGVGATLRRGAPGVRPVSRF